MGIAKALITAVAAGLLLGLPQAPAFADQKGKALLDAMDRAMNFDEGSMRIRIEDRKANGTSRVFIAEALTVLKQATLIEFVDPPREKGKRILMVGDSMWLSVPGTSRPLRLSGRDSFMGTSFTNDDVMNMDRSDDYDATIKGEEAAGVQLLLVARKSSLPYPRMETVVGKDSLPVRSVLYTRSGAASKRIEYSEPKDYGDKVRPSVMTVIDLMASGDSSVVVFESMRAAKVDRAKLSPSSFGR